LGREWLQIGYIIFGHFCAPHRRIEISTTFAVVYASDSIAATGLEYPAESTRKTAVPKTGGAKSGALFGISDPNLALLIDCWPTLPDATKATITALVTEANAGG
jgi:hypothetical protein